MTKNVETQANNEATNAKPNGFNVKRLVMLPQRKLDETKEPLRFLLICLVFSLVIIFAKQENLLCVFLSLGIIGTWRMLYLIYRA